MVLTPTKPDATSATINHFARMKEGEEDGWTIWTEAGERRGREREREKETRGVETGGRAEEKMKERERTTEKEREREGRSVCGFLCSDRTVHAVCTT